MKLLLWILISMTLVLVLFLVRHYNLRWFKFIETSLLISISLTLLITVIIVVNHLLLGEELFWNLFTSIFIMFLVLLHFTLPIIWIGSWLLLMNESKEKRGDIV